MPTPLPASAPKSNKAIAKSFSLPQSRKTRIARRRGRAKGAIESDDEIEREVRTDSDTDDDQSSLDSESEAESVSDGVRMNGRSEVVTPSTTQSPPPLDINGRPPLDSDLSSKPPVIDSAGPFVGATDWADMVSAEHANGAEDLPVIDFADFDRARIDQHLARPARPHKADKPGKKHVAQRSLSAPPTSPPLVPHEDESTGAMAEEEPVASTSGYPAQEPHASRSRGQSARQAYQQRLETDPSYVPTVGGFWGHDDRLLDKNLRSLSGWWRGRWESRGRGRGAFSMRGRGGSFAGPPVPSSQDEDGGEPAPAEIPPIEQAWTHDGFEEMKRRDERRRVLQQPQQQPQAQFRGQRGVGFRGRGGFVGSRGWGGVGRGGALSPTGSRQGLPFGAVAGRPWFAMKPERMWTKQHDAFLYFDPALKPRSGQGPGFRIKFPGGTTQVIRGPPRSFRGTSTAPVVSSSTPIPDDGEKQLVVRLPRRKGKEKAKEDNAAAPVENGVVEEATTKVAELSIEEVFTVRPHIAPNRRVDIPTPPNPPVRRQSYPVSSSATAPAMALSSTVPALRSQPDSPASTSNILEHFQPVSSPERPSVTLSAPVDDSSPSAQILETVLRNPSSTEVNIAQPVPSQEGQRPAPPVLHPLQTTFSPIPQTSPSYGSPYAFGSTLPPGIAMNQHGMPYEMATGRPVYLQPTPPPQMFTPRPMMHGHMSHTSVPFVPSHMHHHSTGSPDFLAHSHTPPMNPFIDPSTGVPIFAPARQSSRIEIRAPTEQPENKKPPARPSGLRTTMSSAEHYPAANGVPPPMFFPGASDAMAPAESGITPANGTMSPDQRPLQVVDPALAYPPYQQPYYYPERYAYPAYMDMSPQPVQYEMYPADHGASQPMIYY